MYVIYNGKCGYAEIRSDDGKIIKQCEWVHLVKEDDNNIVLSTVRRCDDDISNTVFFGNIPVIYDFLLEYKPIYSTNEEEEIKKRIDEYIKKRWEEDEKLYVRVYNAETQRYKQVKREI